MREPSLRRLSRQVVLASALSAVAYLAASTFVYSLVERADERLSAFEIHSDRQVHELTTIVERMGYGGMIHNFKKFVLRGGEERFRVFDMSAGAIQSSLGTLDSLLGPDADEDIAVISATVAEYQSQIDVIREIRRLDGDIEGIDAVVKVDDGAALAALGRLRSRIIARDAPTKAALIFDLHVALGYGGMVHNFKNYVIRKDPSLAEAVRANATIALRDIAAYRALGVDPTEEAALETLTQTIQRYLANTKVVTRMASDGMTAAEIDPVVAVDEDPGTEALGMLSSAVRDDQLHASQQLHETMTILKSGAVILSVLVFLAMALFSYSLWWIIERVVVVPAEQISDGLQRLARGDTRVDLSAYASNNEIGRIAQASRAFRTALIDNKRIAEDLTQKLQALETLDAEYGALDEDNRQVREDQRELFEQRRENREAHRAMLAELDDVVAAALTGDPARRLHPAQVDADLDRIATSINALLDHLQHLQDTAVPPPPSRDAASADADFAGALAQMRSTVQHTLISLSDVVEEVNEGVREIRRRAGTNGLQNDMDLRG